MRGWIPGGCRTTYLAAAPNVVSKHAFDHSLSTATTFFTTERTEKGQGATEYHHPLDEQRVPGRGVTRRP